jgi:hypothetical protein
VSYGWQVFLWIVGMAGAGLAIRPLIHGPNRGKR